VKVLHILCVIIFIVYGGVGALFMGTIVHENYHKWDARDIAKPVSGEDICLMRWPSLTADYSISTDKEGAKIFEERRFNSELVAYTITFIIAFPWAIMIGYLFWRIL